MDELFRARKALTSKAQQLLAQHWREQTAYGTGDGVIELPPHGAIELEPGIRRGAVRALPRRGRPRRWSFASEGELLVALGYALHHLRAAADNVPDDDSLG